MTETKPIEVLEAESGSIPAKADALQVTDSESYARAGELLTGIKGLRKEIELTFGPIVKKAHEAHREAVTQRKKVEAPLAAAEATIKGRIGAYVQAEEQKRRAEEARLAAEAAAADEEARLAEATELEKAGEHEAAERVISEPSTLPPPALPRAVPKVEGVSSREVWKAQVTDPMALVRAVAEGKAPIGLLRIDQGALNQMARALKAELRVPGVKVYRERSVAARAARA